MAGVFNQWFINPRGGYIHIAYTDSESVRDRVMQVISEVIPAAFQPIPHEVAAAAVRDGAANAYIAGFEPNEDGVIVPGCATGTCGLD
jgi:hypothetical protein